MKTTRRHRISLSKETLVHLNEGRMVVGGFSVTQACCTVAPYCNTIHTNCSFCHTCDTCGLNC